MQQPVMNSSEEHSLIVEVAVDTVVGADSASGILFVKYFQWLKLFYCLFLPLNITQTFQIWFRTVLIFQSFVELLLERKARIPSAIFRYNMFLICFLKCYSITMKLNYNKKYAMFPLSKTVILSWGVERQSNGDQQKDKWSMWEEPGIYRNSSS